MHIGLEEAAMADESKRDVAELLIELGFEQVVSHPDGMTVIAPATGRLASVLVDDEDATLRLVKFTLTWISQEFPEKPRLFIRVGGITTVTLALDEYRRYWVTNEHVDLTAHDLVNVTSLVTFSSF